MEFLSKQDFYIKRKVLNVYLLIVII
jgi:hypothetical protein